MVLLKNDGLLPLDLGAVRKVALIGRARRSWPSWAVVAPGSVPLRPVTARSAEPAPGPRSGGDVRYGCRLARGKDGAGAGGAQEHRSGRRPRPPRQRCGHRRGGHQRLLGKRELRPHEHGPAGEQEELVERVLEPIPGRSCPEHGVACHCPVRWSAASLVQCWFGGQELANALVDVLVGDAEPAVASP